MIFRALFGKEPRALSYQSVWGSGGTWQGGLSTHAGKTVDADQATRLTAVYSSVALISDAWSQLPIHNFKDAGDGGRQKLSDPAFLNNDLTDNTQFELAEGIAWSLLLHGNYYAEVLVDRLGGVRSLSVLNPERVTPRRQAGGIVFDVVLDSGETVVANRYRRGEGRGGVLHIPGYRMPGALEGLSPIDRGREAIGLGLVAEEYGGRFFGNGAHAGGVIEVGGPLDKPAVDRLKDGWEEHHVGSSNFHRPGVLTDGARWVSQTVPNDAAQFLETRRFQVSEIARLFRVPPHLISDIEKSTSWGTGVEEQGIGFVTFAITPFLRRAELRLSRLVPRGQYLKWSVNGLLRGRTNDRYSAYQIGRQNGWLSANEIRALEDMNPIAGGDTYVDPAAATTPEPSTDDNSDDDLG